MGPVKLHFYKPGSAIKVWHRRPTSPPTAPLLQPFENLGNLEQPCSRDPLRTWALRPRALQGGRLCPQVEGGICGTFWAGKGGLYMTGQEITKKQGDDARHPQALL